jgi:hypothetical protein
MCEMKQMGWALILLANVCSAQESAEFQPASTNVWAAEYPRALKDFAPRLFR